MHFNIDFIICWIRLNAIWHNRYRRKERNNLWTDFEALAQFWVLSWAQFLPQFQQSTLQMNGCALGAQSVFLFIFQLFPYLVFPSPISSWDGFFIYLSHCLKAYSNWLMQISIEIVDLVAVALIFVKTSHIGLDNRYI